MYLVWTSMFVLKNFEVFLNTPFQLKASIGDSKFTLRENTYFSETSMKKWGRKILILNLSVFGELEKECNIAF